MSHMFFNYKLLVYQRKIKKILYVLVEQKLILVRFFNYKLRQGPILSLFWLRVLEINRIAFIIQLSFLNKKRLFCPDQCKFLLIVIMSCYYIIKE